MQIGSRALSTSSAGFAAQTRVHTFEVWQDLPPLSLVQLS